MKNTRPLPLICIAAFIFLNSVTARAELYPCVTELKIPDYPPLARQAGLEGIVVVKVRFGSSSIPLFYSIHGPHKLLESASKHAMDKSSFSSECVGEVEDIVFDFRLMSPRKRSADNAVFFKPPNIFIIRSNQYPIGGEKASGPGPGVGNPLSLPLSLWCGLWGAE